MQTTAKNRIEPFVNGKAGAPQGLRPGAKPPTGGRNGAGQFQPGCKPGPGNPFAKQVATLRKALLDSVTGNDVARLGQKLLAQALAGDVAAAKVLLSYAVGKPAPAVDPDRLELEACRLILAWPTVAEAIAATQAVRPSVAAALVEQFAADSVDAALVNAANPSWGKCQYVPNT